MSSTTFNTVNTETMSSKCELGQGADVYIDSLSRDYLVHNIASIFTQIARKNDRLDPKSITKPTSLSFPTGYKPLTAASLRLANKKASFFFSLRYRPEESLESLLDYVVKSCPSGTNAIFFGLLVYMSRLAKISRTGRGPFLVHSFNVNVLVLMALIAAAKYFSDRRYSMLAYQGASTYPKEMLDGLELDFLFCLDFQLGVSMDEMQDMANQLSAFAETGELPPSLSPLIYSTRRDDEGSDSDTSRSNNSNSIHSDLSFEDLSNAHSGSCKGVIVSVISFSKKVLVNACRSLPRLKSKPAP